jgi:DHA2 family multidrug resistance protein-like MFS transporter
VRDQSTARPAVGEQPERAGLVLISLIAVAAVANLNLSVANVALPSKINDSVQDQLTKSYASAAAIAERYPQYAQPIIDGAKSSFLSGADWAYTAGIIAILLGAVIVFFLFPKRDREVQLLAAYHAEDTKR